MPTGLQRAFHRAAGLVKGRPPNPRLMMRVLDLHPWDVSYHEAVAIQESLRGKLRLQGGGGPRRIRTVAGADVSYNKRSPDLFAAVVVMELPSLEVIETVAVKAKATFPYIPGLLSFREIPPVARAFEKLQSTPDAVLCDGQGIAHPRGFGLASHLGVLLDVPTVGCAKSLFVGEHQPVPKRRWSWRELVYKDRVIGTVLRTRANVNPIYVSPGHRISHEGAVELARRCTGNYRIPEPTRQAHHAVNEARRTG